MTHAVVVREPGGPDALRWEPQEVGDPPAGFVRVKVAAAGVNFIDVYHRTGLYPRPVPFVAGLEGAGVVDAVGEGVVGLRPGDHVAWAQVPGSYAEHVLAPADKLVRVPAGTDDDVAAAAMLQGMTAHYLTWGVRITRPGDVALVHAAAGGVGLLLVQMLKSAGARVIGTCSTDAKAALVREAGADDVVLYSKDDFVAAARRFSDDRGVDVVYDSVGATTFEGSLQALRPRGLLCSYGQSSGVIPPFQLTRLNDLGSLFITRPSLFHYAGTRAELEQRATDVLGAIAQGRLRMHIGARVPLARAADAHRALEGRETTGKVLLVA